jgi:hypothetical protein
MKGAAAAGTHHEDEEETAALISPPPPCPNDDAAALRCKHNDSTGSMAVDQQTEQRQSSGTKPWRTKAFPTRSIVVALLMGIFVVLALLHGTTTSGWVHLSSSVSLAVAT